jgi:type I restriction enzyme M protein
MVINNRLGGFSLSNSVDRVKFEVYNLLRDKIDAREYYVYMIALAYIAYYSKKRLPKSMLNFDYRDVLSKLGDKHIISFLESKLTKFDESIVHSILQHDIENLQELIIDAEPDGSRFNGDYTPQFIVALANKLLNVKPNQSVADLCSGFGNYSVFSTRNFPTAKFSAFEINPEMIAVAKIRSITLAERENNSNISVYEENILKRDEKPSFDKSFMHMPFSLRANTFDDYDKIKKKIPLFSNLSRSSSLDWTFLVHQLMSLKESGTGVAIATVASAFNVIDRKFREYFIENKHIKAVIALPEKLFPSTAIKTVIYVLGYNNSKVKMIDASNYFTPERRQNILTDDDIAQIIMAYETDNSDSITVSADAIRNNDYVLLPNRYLTDISYKNGVRLGEFASIKRGAPLTAADLDKISTIESTENQYLMLADISEGIISDELHFITKIEASLDKYTIKERNLILSKIGAPFKVAILDKRETKILANGNLYIIEVDEKKANPYYLQAFLQSNEGQRLLSTRAAGIQFATIGIKNLSDLEIPLPSIEQQNALGKKMKDAILDIKRYNRELEKTRTMISSLFNAKGGK